MSFPVPTTNDPTHRYQEATDAARMALEALVADANAAGWSTDEITVALVEAARSLKEATQGIQTPPRIRRSAISMRSKDRLGVASYSTE
ncbi:hypothetical protein FHT93_005624 [Rhizobium sp. BK379]|nr:hypothetical protein [Rhizobium sp. BK379]